MRSTCSAKALIAGRPRSGLAGDHPGAVAAACSRRSPTTVVQLTGGVNAGLLLAMPVTRWIARRRPKPDREYMVLLTYLPLKRYRALFRFTTYLTRIRRQLAGAHGLIGYSLRAQPWRLRFWTLSVWRSESALREFVHQGSHMGAMVLLRSEVGETRFTRWSILGGDVPPDWKDALAHEAADYEAPNAPPH